jgi:hypothetical protein
MPEPKRNGVNWPRLRLSPGQPDELSGDPNQIVRLLQLVRLFLLLTHEPCQGLL